MKKFDLLQFGDSVIRVLEVRDDMVLVIDCIKLTMPVWVKSDTLEKYSECNDIVKHSEVDVDSLDTEQRKVMYERFTMISSILPFVGDKEKRSQCLRSAAEKNGLSVQTVRSYLCSYLAYMDIAVLAPKKQQHERDLTQDEKNIRWALNKFFYTTAKQALFTAYTMMLK